MWPLSYDRYLRGNQLHKIWEGKNHWGRMFPCVCGGDSAAGCELRWGLFNPPSHGAFSMLNPIFLRFTHDETVLQWSCDGCSGCPQSAQRCELTPPRVTRGVERPGSGILPGWDTLRALAVPFLVERHRLGVTWSSTHTPGCVLGSTRGARRTSDTDAERALTSPHAQCGCSWLKLSLMQENGRFITKWETDRVTD